MTSGRVFWDDGKLRNLNKKKGSLPDYNYRWFTEIGFCCRTDGDKDDPILLPSKFPFFLLAYESSKCQMVKWAVASLEWIYYSTSDRNNDDQRNGSYPYNAGKMHPTIYYCYYQGKETNNLYFSEHFAQHLNCAKTDCEKFLANATTYIQLFGKFNFSWR